MFRGLYTATSGMMANNRQQQVLTNNLANAATPGFKKDQSVMRAFPAQLIKAMETGGTTVGGQTLPSTQKSIGSLQTGVYAQEGIPSFTQGALKNTGNSTDLALLSSSLPVNPETGKPGTVSFAVALPNDEIRYTQNGQFTVDAAGFLTTAEGFNVLDRDLQPIQVNSTDFTIGANGEVASNDGDVNNSLFLSYTENPQQFIKEGQNLLRWAGDPALAPVSIELAGLGNTGPLVQQGYIEQSNVDLTQTMTDMMKTYRGFESNQKIIQAYDRSMEKAVNEIGRV
ncbi:flagellar hook-basal body protein [Planococcus salinarum]|uniref:flagellar hook-basal body protein n=1 Tax=Planococcus salinarum TaxID=622695 RepID=UPI000E3DA542|nr:flagellar hook-basal body protein [Planococcus salinarum]TAA72221.1 flagellar hook-basal body protein [Planococcus salinarum]